ncbi:uncharacterized protein A4U43_C04F10220 [Asparagus officinalis]|uniref:Uncharacterized protein n=1 Tax=Asparagus officinalis TaxID=4686 RepID=A0A5P1EZR4_ASPOF|nr:uncharacterized protein LOC109837008 [Asparagus officinalis]XP_020260675.1 uncharacterized protein LOC109837008 [Asparagus officinalis]XP_020260676.1 uncharacterized protein LOC109837008 [Asparagus officinalis]ONK71586.1 uncharacterized protein A4U43_C04F10220 [Asparagus officinalis]
MFGCYDEMELMSPNPSSRTLISINPNLPTLPSQIQCPRSLPLSPPHSRSAVNPTLLLRRRSLALRCSPSEAAGDPQNSSPQDQSSSRVNFWTKWKVDSAEMRSRMAKLGLAAVLAYGLFDGVTYTTFFVLAFLGYEKSTGKNPAANLQALLGIVLLMWTGNNVTRPFRVAGAAALAPVIDKELKRIQKNLNLPSQIFAFALVVVIIASSCFAVVGLLILSRWGK